MPPLFSAILNSAVIGIYDGKTPVSTAVFFSPARALTAYHDAEPKVGDILTGASAPNVKPVRHWKFKVVATSSKDDLVVLEIHSGAAAPSHFLRLVAEGSIASVRHAEVWLATFGISAAKHAAENPMDISLGSYTDRTRVAACGTRHFVYKSGTGRGDSGGAIISLTGQLIGLHLGGWNDSSPPPSPEQKGAGSSAAAGGAASRPVAGRGGKKAEQPAEIAALIKNHERAMAMGIDKVGSATRKSILKLSQQLAIGGYAIHLGSAAMSNLCNGSSGAAAEAGAGAGAGAGSSSTAGAGAGAASSSSRAGGAASSGSGRAGNKRKAGGAELGGGASGKKRK